MLCSSFSPIISKQVPTNYRLSTDQDLEYFQNVYSIFSDQKNYRIRRDLETYKFLKLDSEKRKDHFEPEKIGYRDDMDLEKPDDNAEVPFEDDEKPVKTKQMTVTRKSIDLDVSTSNQSIEDDANTSRQQQSEASGLSPEELQMLEIENKQLISGFKGLSEEVQQIEKHVYDIAKLQELFTEKVCDAIIARLATDFISSTFRLRCKKETSSESPIPSSVQQKTFVKPTSRSNKLFKGTLGLECTFSSSFLSCRLVFYSSTGTMTETNILLHFVLLKINRKAFAILIENFNFILPNRKSKIFLETISCFI